MSAPATVVSLKPTAWCGSRSVLRCSKEGSIMFASENQPVASSAGSGDREPPSSTVWNCHLHDRLV